jgi:hypothetical protein
MLNDDHDNFGDIFICVCLWLITRSYDLIGTWRTTQENSTTTRHMALSWLINQGSFVCLLALVAWGTEECFYDSYTLDGFWNGSALLG